MKTSAEVIENISQRYKEVRNKKLEFLWEDFLQAVEKATSKIPDEILAATRVITIFYFTKEGDNNIYRSQTAECAFLDDQKVEYEEEDVPLGTRDMLENAFIDFKDKAEKDISICADWFEVETLMENNREIPLDFLLPKKL